jgi:hypothetical protein
MNYYALLNAALVGLGAWMLVTVCFAHLRLAAKFRELVSITREVATKLDNQISVSREREDQLKRELQVLAFAMNDQLQALRSQLPKPKSWKGVAVRPPTKCKCGSVRVGNYCAVCGVAEGVPAPSSNPVA